MSAHTPEMTGEAVARATFIGKRAKNVEAHISRTELVQIATAAAHYDRQHNGHATLLEALILAREWILEARLVVNIPASQTLDQIRIAIAKAGGQ